MERYKIEQSGDQITVTDTLYLICIIFTIHKWNETQRAVILDDNVKPDVMQLAQAMREVGDYMAINYPELVF